MRIKESKWYLITDVLLDLLTVFYLLFLAWHFYIVVGYGRVTVQEPTPWILRTEIYVLVPGLIIFGLWKLMEDIIMFWKEKMGLCHIITELILGLIYLSTTGFITYHFLHIWAEDESLITSDNPWMVIGMLILCAILGTVKTWEDIGDLKKIK